MGAGGYLYLFVIAGLPIIILIWFSINAKKEGAKIACPHCGAKWFRGEDQGYWVEYFCYNCQRYWG